MNLGQSAIAPACLPDAHVNDMEPLRHIYPAAIDPKMNVALCGHRRSALDPPRERYDGASRYCATCKKERNGS